MNTVAIETLIVLAILAGVVLWRLAQAIKSDGYGVRRPPASHYDEWGLPEQPSERWVSRLPQF